MAELRASDQDRERTAFEIREHFAAGRLSQEELDQRLSEVYAAPTQAQLASLRADLPALPPSPAQRKAELVQRRSELQRRLLQQTGGSLGVFIVCVVIWLASGGHHGHGEFWPVWVLIFPALTLLRNGWRLYGPAPELDRVERELARRRHGHHGQQERHARHRDRRL